jgi:DNA-binding response OmpR family regulator
VLVVDADLRSVHTLATALRHEGFAVHEAASFAEGKRLWATKTPDVLVVDIRLGQFNGLQLLMRARSDRPDLVAIITCPFADVVLEAETRRFGGTFLIKPVEPWQIVQAVKNATMKAKPLETPLMSTDPHVDRRRVERRQLHTPNFTPERRVADRRVVTASIPDRRATDRRQLVIPGFAPDRRRSDRRAMTAI